MRKVYYIDKYFLVDSWKIIFIFIEKYKLEEYLFTLVHALNASFTCNEITIFWYKIDICSEFEHIIRVPH